MKLYRQIKNTIIENIFLWAFSRLKGFPYHPAESIIMAYMELRNNRNTLTESALVSMKLLNNFISFLGIEIYEEKCPFCSSNQIQYMKSLESNVCKSCNRQWSDGSSIRNNAKKMTTKECIEEIKEQFILSAKQGGDICAVFKPQSITDDVDWDIVKMIYPSAQIDGYTQGDKVVIKIRDNHWIKIN